MNLPPAGGSVLHIVVDAESDGQRLDVFLARARPGASRARLQKLIAQGSVRVEGVSVRPSRRVRAGERVSLEEPPPEPAEAEPEDIPLCVLFEDADLLVLDKPAGLVVHPAAGNPAGTLVNALLHHCSDLSGVGGVLRPGIVHRLDRDTSGVMLVAKNDASHRFLAQEFHERRVEKTYRAFACARPGARPLPPQGRIETRYGRHPVERKRFSSRVAAGKAAVTDYRVERSFETDDWLVLEVRLHPRTGRTHQLRVHLADAGYPILGDRVYAGRRGRKLPRELWPARQALHAERIAFCHPRTKEPMVFSAPLPADMLALRQELLRLTS